MHWINGPDLVAALLKAQLTQAVTHPRDHHWNRTTTIHSLDGEIAAQSRNSAIDARVLPVTGE
jgi:hypothetical protein